MTFCMVLIDTTNWIKYRNSSELATQYIVDTLGAMEASSGASKESMVVGFDATDDAIASIKGDQMAGAIAQHPT